MNIACINIKGKLGERLPQLDTIMEKRDIDILILTETKIAIELPELNIGKTKYYIASSGNQYIGIGVMSRLPIQHQFIGKRTIKVTVCNRIIIGVYLPHEGSKDEETE